MLLSAASTPKNCFRAAIAELPYFYSAGIAHPDHVRKRKSTEWQNKLLAWTFRVALASLRSRSVSQYAQPQKPHFSDIHWRNF
jgi:hypothetical protein